MKDHTKNYKKEYLLEACVDSVESALAAVRGGADRLEVCANLVIGGTTPGVSQFRQIRELCDIPLHVLIRPRCGDFLYTDAEFRMMCEDTEMFRELGADGIVAGCLKPDGNLDMERMKALRETSGTMHLTLSRAFDLSRDPFLSLEHAVDAGADTILTSGQRDNCLAGVELLGRLIERAAGRIGILVGGGVNEKTVISLMEAIPAGSFHMSGKTVLDSEMVYRRPGVSMGLPGFSEYEIFRTDEQQIRLVKKVLEKYNDANDN